MLTYYCPDCWQIVDAKDKICPHCGYSLEEFSRLDYHQKLLDALHHTIPERRMIAAQILGNLKIPEAVPYFKEILAVETEDYYFLRAVLLALAKIDHPERMEIIENATHHPSGLVRSFAIRLMEKIKNNEIIETWDKFSG
jgi:HEAT repeat protein